MSKLDEKNFMDPEMLEPESEDKKDANEDFNVALYKFEENRSKKTRIAIYEWQALANKIIRPGVKVATKEGLEEIRHIVYFVRECRGNKLFEKTLELLLDKDRTAMIDDAVDNFLDKTEKEIKEKSTATTDVEKSMTDELRSSIAEVRETD